MHMLGRAIKVELNPGTPEAKVVLDVPQFDFDNQRLMTAGVAGGHRSGGHPAGDVDADAGLRK